MSEPAEPRATWAAYALLLLSVITTIAVCLLVGGQWFAAVMSVLPHENRNGMELPDEDFVGLPVVGTLIGIVIFGVAILPGLAIYYAGQWLCTRLGIAVWITEEEPCQMAQPRWR